MDMREGALPQRDRQLTNPEQAYQTGNDQRLFVLNLSAKQGGQQFTVWCGRVHLSGQGARDDALMLEFGDRGQEVGERSSKAIELPQPEPVITLDTCEGCLEAGAIVAGA